MAKMKVYQRSRLKFSDEDAGKIEALLGVYDDEGAITKEPPEFPLTGTTVIFNGASCVVSAPNEKGRNVRMFRLNDAKFTEPRNPRDKPIINGTCVELVAAGVLEEHAKITFVIEEYAVCKAGC